MNLTKKSSLPIYGITCVIAGLLFVLAAFISTGRNSDEVSEPEAKKKGKAASQVMSQTEIGSPFHDYFYTFRHDNHLFIARNGGGSGTPLHHPDCPCGRAK